MATTTNFGWETPDDTDLVKDGAAAMRTLGNSIDTSFVELKGGTTGQILSKASNTDLDYTWIANDQGDITGVTAGTGITGGGTSGAVTVSFDQANFGGGQLASGKNRSINSNFSVWQRGTSFTIPSSLVTYTADRWLANRNATGSTVTRQATGDTTNLPFIQYCTRISRDSGNTSTTVISYGQNFESVNSIPLAGKTVTLSFYARKGANYSPTTNYVTLKTGTGTDQNYISGFTGVQNAILQNPTFTTTWARYSYTATLDATTTQVAIGFDLTPVGTAGAADYLEITGVQLEVGSTASPYAPNGATYQAELAACRYYYRRNTSTLGYGVILPAGSAASTTAAVLAFTDGPMRINPTSVDFATNFLDDGAGVVAVTNITMNGASSASVPLLTVTVASGLTQFRPYRLTVNAGAAGYIGVSAEL